MYLCTNKGKNMTNPHYVNYSVRKRYLLSTIEKHGKIRSQVYAVQYTVASANEAIVRLAIPAFTDTYMSLTQPPQCSLSCLFEWMCAALASAPPPQISCFCLLMLQFFNFCVQIAPINLSTEEKARILAWKTENISTKEIARQHIIHPAPLPGDIEYMVHRYRH